MKKEELKKLIYKRFEECETISQFRQDVFDLIDLFFEEQKDKYYFFTLQATNRDGHDSSWNYITDKNPIESLLKIQSAEEKGSRSYYNFVIINSFEITKEEYEKYKNKFDNG